MTNSRDTIDVISNDMPPVKPGMYLATVTGVLDKTFMGSLRVKLLHAGAGNSDYKGQHLIVKYMSPFYGVTSEKYIKQNDDFDSTQKSYGMWMVPPDPGTTVIVLFMQGSPKYGYWIGCVPDENMNFMVPGLAATKYASNADEERVPVAEYNKLINETVADVTKANKPQHPFTEALIAQGLIKDDARGITTSSARREAPSMVFGISTPGPVDKDGIEDEVGTIDDFVVAPVSRLGGSTFVMDDGDDKFIRKTPAGEGPPEYAQAEQGETDGDRKIPHNELIRLRTRTGHQILLHNSEDLIYIGNAKGTTWIELTSNGKIDIFAEDSISIHTKNDLNIRAARDVNIEAGRNMNLKGLAKFHAEGNAVETVATTDTKITSGGTSHINSKSSHLETAGKIYMNSAQKAVAAVPLPTIQVPTDLGDVLESITMRVPMHEPWPHHENLDPQSFIPSKTDRETLTTIPLPDSWKKYSLINDTFDKFIPPDTTQSEA